MLPVEQTIQGLVKHMKKLVWSGIEHHHMPLFIYE